MTSLYERSQAFDVTDSALRRGEWSAFGRAFDALRQALDVAPDSGDR